MNKKILLAGILGNIIEWYDVTIYSLMSTIFSHVFFPHVPPWLALTAVYAAFASGFIARPISSLAYGYIGDRYGRKAALVISISFLSVAMIGFAVLPTFAQVGALAPILLLTLRVLQGVFAGSETIGSYIYVLESAKKKKYGFYGALSHSTAIVGILVGSGIAAIVQSSISPSHFALWGWRLLYAIGALFGLVALFIRTYAPQSTAFTEYMKKEKGKKQASPLVQVLHHYKLTLILVAGILAFSATNFYFLFFYFPDFITHYFHEPAAVTPRYTSMYQAIFVVLAITIGWFSDKFNKVKFLMVVLCCAAVIISILFLSGFYKNDVADFIFQLVFMVLVAAYAAPLPAVFVQAAPVAVRYSVLSIGGNLGYTLFGGFAPVIINLLFHWHGRVAVTIYLVS